MGQGIILFCYLPFCQPLAKVNYQILLIAIMVTDPVIVTVETSIFFANAVLSGSFLPDGSVSRVGKLVIFGTIIG